MDPEERSTRRPLVLLAVALGLWGLYLAVGATGVFVQRSLFDPRKSAIVVACVGAFLALWGFVLRTRRGSATDAAVWSRAALSGLFLVTLAVAAWLAAVALWPARPAVVTGLGWFSALMIGAAVIAALIALSQPARLRGKFLALLPLLLAAAAVVAFWLRMTPR
jgi:hypothetical protein